MRRGGIVPLGLAALVGLVSVVAASPAGLDTHVVTSEKPGGYDYLVHDWVADLDGELWLTNVDLRAHDVVAVELGPNTSSWCHRFPKDQCPLFASALIGTGQRARVEGLDRLEPDRTYEFYCSTHPWMHGALHTI